MAIKKKVQSSDVDGGHSYTSATSTLQSHFVSRYNIFHQWRVEFKDQKMKALDITYCSLVGVILLPSTICNVIMLMIFLRKPSLRSVPNSYLTSVLIANLISVILEGFSLMYMAFPEVVDGFSYCIIISTIERFIQMATITSLVGLSVERYKYFVRSSNYIPDKLETKKILGTIWTASLVYTAVCFAIEMITQNLSTTMQNDSICNFESDHMISVLHFCLDVTFMFFISSVVMTRHYFWIVKTLWFSAHANIIQQRKRKQSVIMLISISVIQTILLLFVNVLKILSVTLVSNITEHNWVLLGSTTVHTVMFLVLPAIYLAFSEQLRTALKGICVSSKVTPDTGCRVPSAIAGRSRMETNTEHI